MTEDESIGSAELRPDDALGLADATQPTCARLHQPIERPRDHQGVATPAPIGDQPKLRPEYSARGGLTTNQIAVLSTLSFATIVGLHADAAATCTMLGWVFTALFALLLAIRLLAVMRLMLAPVEAPPPAVAEAALPTYAVLVALYDEAAVVPQLVTALAALDYPPARLDIVFALEAHDGATLAALATLGLPSHMRWTIVPEGKPRTKPRALCHALSLASGALVVVYDAEDQPEPDQLRKAVAAFGAGGQGLGCVQARLNVYNRHENLLAAQFAIEYTALFDAILPAFAAHGFPVLLGGTSNHFPRAVLDTVGGWDPYNVTEDADLGVRLARFGFRVGVLASTTWEEAPPRWQDWLAQRTRWQKGWMQTYFVHMRHPVRLWRDLGAWSWLWLQVVLAGGLVSSLVHPWFYAWLAWGLASDALSKAGSGPLAGQLWWGAVGTMIAAYGAAIIAALVTVRARGFHDLYRHALAAPFYWLPISLATYRALWEWVCAPHYWAKTPHGAREKASGTVGRKQ